MGGYIYQNLSPPRQTSFSDGDGRLCLYLYPSYVHKQYEGLYRDSPWSNPTTESIPGVKFGLGGSRAKWISLEGYSEGVTGARQRRVQKKVSSRY